MDLLDIRQLRAFQELAQRQSFTSAAHALHRTQSAVSHSIKALESGLDMVLFERQGKAVRLTPAGTKFYPYVCDIIHRMQRAVDVIESIRQPGHGRLSVGATASISHAILPAVLREFRESFPNFEITVSTDDTRGLLRLLGQNEIDVALGLRLSGTSSFHFHPLFADHIVMAMAPIHPLAHQTEITPVDLKNEDFIFYSRKSETYQILAQGFASMDRRIRGHYEVGSMAAIKEMARIGMGIGLLAPWIAQEELAAQALVLRSLPWKQSQREWGLYSHHPNPNNIAEQVFCGLIAEVAHSLETTSILAVDDIVVS